MKFKKEWLQGLVWKDHEEAEIVVNEIEDHSRWSIRYELVFKYKDKYYTTYYCIGATEYQDEQPFEYENDEIECTEVVPTIKQIIVYEPK